MYSFGKIFEIQTFLYKVNIYDIYFDKWIQYTSMIKENRKFFFFAGALCGLGFDENGYSLHPNNDMEITFDIHVDDLLLLNVNKIRLGINLILTDKEWEDAKIGHHEKVVAELQQFIRKDVIDLFL